MPCTPEFIHAATALADIARSRAIELFRGEIGLEVKADRSLVTQADKAIETDLRAAIMSWFPDHGIVGEEFPSHNPSADLQWVIDPIDGTYRFAAGHPQFSCLIALARNNKPILGVIDMPMLDERWIGAAGRQTLYICNGVQRLARARACPAVDQATIYFSGGIMASEQPRDLWNALAGQNRLLDGDAYAAGMVASGLADVMVDNQMKPWDFMAFPPIVEGAGGLVTDWAGEPLTLQSGNKVLITGDARLGPAVMAQLTKLG